MLQRKTKFSIAGFLLAGAVAFFATRQPPATLIPPAIQAQMRRDAKSIVARGIVETIAFEIDANGYVLGGIIVKPDWTPEDAKAHCQSKNSYVLWTSDSKFVQPGAGYKFDGKQFIPPQPYKTWTLDETKLQWMPDVEKPDDKTPYYYVAPNEAKGETKGSWTSDPQKVSPPETGPPLERQTYPAPKAQKVAELKPFTGFQDGTPYLYLASREYEYSVIRCSVSIDYFGVGGAGGSKSTVSAGGGGGGGGVITGTFTGAVASYVITIGAGGSGAAGSDSTMDLVTAMGGGYAPTSGANGGNGGNGSGGSGDTGSGTTGGTSTQTSNNGGTGFGNAGGTNNTTNPYPAGGGGGAGAVGGNATSGGVGGAGGSGKTGLWTTSNVAATYGGGGGGAVNHAYGSGTGGAGGAGGGGAGGNGNGGAEGVAGTANTGGGAGGVSNNNTIAGGSGKWGFRYLISDSVTQTGGTASNDGTNTVVMFTTSGTFQITALGGTNTSNFFPFFSVIIPPINIDLWNRSYLAEIV